MILEPRQMWSLERELETPGGEKDLEVLKDLHKLHRLNEHTGVRIPQYWAKIVLGGVREILLSFPQVRFGGIHENHNRLHLNCIPTHRPLNAIKYRIYNELDDCIINVIDEMLNRRQRPHFLSIS